MGVFTGLFHERTRVVEEAEGYVWYRLDGTRLCFDAGGRLAWLEDAKGNRLTLAYDVNGQSRSVRKHIGIPRPLPAMWLAFPGGQ